MTNVYVVSSNVYHPSLFRYTAMFKKQRQSKGQGSRPEHGLLPVDSCLELINLAEKVWKDIPSDASTKLQFGNVTPLTVEVSKLNDKNKHFTEVSKCCSQIGNHLIHGAIPDTWPLYIDRHIVENNSKILIGRLRRICDYKRNVAINYQYSDKEDAYIQYFSFNLDNGRRVGFRVMSMK